MSQNEKLKEDWNLARWLVHLMPGPTRLWQEDLFKANLSYRVRWTWIDDR